MNERQPKFEVEIPKPVEFSIMENPQTRQLLRDRVEQLIERAREERVDALVFLDAPARPASVVLREVWKREHPDEPRPDIRFVNVDGSWERHRSRAKEVDPISSDMVEEARELFGAQFDGKKVLLVDGAADGEEGSAAAKELLQRAFPTTQVESVMLAKPEENIQFPWTELPGAGGVLELSESVVGHAALEHRVEAVHDMLVARMDALLTTERREAIESDMALERENLGNVMSRILEDVRRLEDQPGAPAGLAEDMRFAYEQFLLAFPEGGKKTSVVDKILSIALLSKLAAEISSAQWSDESDETSALRQRMTADADALGESCANSVCSTSCNLMNHRAMVIGEQAAQYADPKRVARRATQLRDEMKAIAEMPVTAA